MAAIICGCVLSVVFSFILQTSKIVIELITQFICGTMEPTFDPDLCGCKVIANLGTIVLWFIGLKQCHLLLCCALPLQNNIIDCFINDLCCYLLLNSLPILILQPDSLLCNKTTTPFGCCVLNLTVTDNTTTQIMAKRGFHSSTDEIIYLAQSRSHLLE